MRSLDGKELNNQRLVYWFELHRGLGSPSICGPGPAATSKELAFHVFGCQKVEGKKRFSSASQEVKLIPVASRMCAILRLITDAVLLELNDIESAAIVEQIRQVFPVKQVHCRYSACRMNRIAQYLCCSVLSTVRSRGVFCRPSMPCAGNVKQSW